MSQRDHHAFFRDFWQPACPSCGRHSGVYSDCPHWTCIHCQSQYCAVCRRGFMRDEKVHLRCARPYEQAFHLQSWIERNGWRMYNNRHATTATAPPVDAEDLRTRIETERGAHRITASDRATWGWSAAVRTATPSSRDQRFTQRASQRRAQGQAHGEEDSSDDGDVVEVSPPGRAESVSSSSSGDDGPPCRKRPRTTAPKLRAPRVRQRCVQRPSKRTGGRPGRTGATVVGKKKTTHRGRTGARR